MAHLGKRRKKIFIQNENAQEDYANLDWISKEQALEIINKRAGNKLTDENYGRTFRN